MNISAPFIRRPIGTSLLAAALLLSGILAFNFLPVSSLPRVDFPVISVGAQLPGADPQTMASAVATPLERQFGRISGVNQMTSSSQLGSTGIALQFDLNRNIDAAARDVQAAINAARSQLPSNLPSNPTYRKINPADAPILILALTSDTFPVARLYDTSDSILAQKLSQVNGVGQVFTYGSAPPAVRAEVNPTLLNKLGVGLDTVRNSLNLANANQAKGQVFNQTTAITLDDNDQLFTADEYRPLIVAYRNGGPVRLGDVADVQDSVADVRNLGLANGKPGVLVIIFRQPGANIIQTVDRVRALMPYLQSSISPAIKLDVVMDRTVTVRASVKDIEKTLLISIVLVILVVFVFLRTVRATVIPSIAVPLSLVGTFSGMYLLGYSLDNLSLMALAISTGFVVDDAIVVLENITRYVEHGMDAVQAAFKGASEIGFTVLSMSTSLVAVFIPLLMMGGIVGRLFREFAVTLSIAIGVSLVVSLTTTPTMCAKFLRPSENENKRHNIFYRSSEWFFDSILAIYRQSLKWVLAHQTRNPGRDNSCRVPERVSLHHCAEGIFPAAGYGTPHGAGAGGARHLVPGHERQDGAVRNNCDEGSGRLHGSGVRRWRLGDQPGPVLRYAESARGAQPLPDPALLAILPERYGRRRNQSTAGQAGRGSRSYPVFAIGAGPHDWWTLRRGAIPIHAARRRFGRTQPLGAAAVR